MKRAQVVALSAWIIGGFVGMGGACSGGQGSADVPPTVPITTEPTASATASESATGTPSDSSPDLNDPSQVNATKWTDEDAIRALAKDCRWDPAGCIAAIEAVAPEITGKIEWAPEEPAQPAPGDRKWPKAECENVFPLSCGQTPDTVHAYDICMQTDYTCVPECDRGCTSCAGKCVASCEACKAPCKDDACRMECAKSCGQCRQKCVTDLDQCAGAMCAERSETCFRERDDLWSKSACSKVCPRVQACMEACPGVERDYSMVQFLATPCVKSCLRVHGKGCPESLDQICAGISTQPFSNYHEQRKAQGKK